ncbi:glutamate synthase subunit beta [Paenibacillus sp. y28]|uniref:glutamate synthase subunit beta n=1 Tax=Paenibacillus sp. y28 TaxID=3129110 RepID=UPI00301A4725
MGSTTGFMEFKRQLPTDRHPLERIKDWKEFHLHLTEEQLKTQGSRCMDCGIPYCNSGVMLSGSTSGCPIHNLIPEWNDLVYRGLWKEALQRLLKTNNFPEFTGRICPAPCEGACTVGISDEPVAIKTIEQAIVDKGFEEGWIVPEAPKHRTGKKVAVIGSGPAGMAAAAQLNKAGHLVTVFERADRIGGLLTYGIPSMKLEKNVVERRVKLMEQEGITFVTNTEIGKNYESERLLKEFDAVVLCTGSTRPREVGIPGSDLKGIHFAMDYLTGTIKSQLDSNFADGNFIDTAGKDVIVVGGGDTGTDCVATALRQSCNSVTQFHTHPKGPDAREWNDNPWPEFPKVYQLDYAQEEAKALYGNDPRQFACLTKKFVGDENGNVKELHTIDMQWVRDENGSIVRQPIEGSERVWKADAVFVAIGFTGPEQGLLQQLGVETDKRSNVKAEYGKYATNVPGIFAAGDNRRGQSLVVWAINEGREAAREVDRYLMGTSNLP